MMKLVISCIFLIGLAVSCTPPSVAPAKKIFRSIGDPFFTPDAPKLVQLKDIKIVNQPSPWGGYPQAAKDKGVQGDVLLEIWIDPTGTPTKAGVLWGATDLHQAAVDYILRWKFRPFSYEGSPQSCRFRMVMPFRLRVGADYLRLPADLSY